MVKPDVLPAHRGRTPAVRSAVVGPTSRVTCLDTAVTMLDGLALATDVTVADDGERHPVLLFRTPYGRSSVRGHHDAIGLARLGWAVVTQDVRGRWDSPGDFAPFRSERSDGAQTVDWCGSQPWSNGAVAMAGASYNGFTQWLAAAERHPALRVIAPAVAGPDLRSAVYEGGALELGVLSSWTLGIGAVGSNLDAAVIDAAVTELDDWPETLRTGSDGALPRISPDWKRWFDPDDADLWDPLDAGRSLLDGHPMPKTGEPPAGYHLAGWHDLFCESTIAGYELLTGAGVDERVRRRQRLVVGPWSHASMLRRTTGFLDFGVAAQGEFNGLYDEQLTFLTAAIGGSTDVPSGVRVFVMGANRWLDLPSWPPPATPYFVVPRRRRAASPGRRRPARGPTATATTPTIPCRPSVVAPSIRCRRQPGRWTSDRSRSAPTYSSIRATLSTATSPSSAPCVRTWCSPPRPLPPTSPSSWSTSTPTDRRCWWSTRSAEFENACRASRRT